MFSISELSRKLNVSTQSLYKKINKSMKDELQPYVKTLNGQKYIDEQGAELIKNSLQPLSIVANENEETVVNQHGINSKNNDNIEEKPVDNEFATVDNEIIKLLQQNTAILQKQLEIKDNQLEAKDRQINELTQTVKNLSESISADSKNQLAETLIEGNEKLIEAQQPKKQNLFSKIFSRGNQNKKKDS